MHSLILFAMLVRILVTTPYSQSKLVLFSVFSSFNFLSWCSLNVFSNYKKAFPASASMNLSESSVISVSDFTYLISSDTISSFILLAIFSM